MAVYVVYANELPMSLNSTMAWFQLAGQFFLKVLGLGEHISVQFYPYRYLWSTCLDKSIVLSTLSFDVLVLDHVLSSDKVHMDLD